MSSTFDHYARRMTDADVETNEVRGWRCDRPRCREVARVFAVYRYRAQDGSGAVRIGEKFLCGEHGAEFADTHHITIEAARGDQV